MPRTSHATFVRRRLLALLALAGLLVGGVLLVGGLGSGSDDPRAAGQAEVKATPARPPTVAAIAARADVPALGWHQIRPLRATDSAQDRTYIVPPKTLDRQLGALRRAGYSSVSADQVADHMATGAKLPPKPVLLSFDDASEGQYTRALPLLKKHGQTATFFVMTDKLDRSAPMLTARRVLVGPDVGRRELLGMIRQDF